MIGVEKYILVLDGRSLKVILKRKGLYTELGFPGGSDGKESICSVAALGSIPGVGRSLEEGKATHSSILAWRIPMDRGAWRASVHGVTKESDMTEQLSVHTHRVGRSSVGHLCSQSRMDTSC